MTKVMVRYGELVLKGGNIQLFKRIIHTHINNKLKGLFSHEEVRHDLLMFDVEEENLDLFIERLNKISGLESYSIVRRADKSLDSIVEVAVKMIDEEFGDGDSFKVESKRADKTFSLTSQELSIVASKLILPRLKKSVIVDVHNPKHTLLIDIRLDAAYLSSKKVYLMGGMPYGCEGKTLLLLSGGIDSPVAAYYLIKKGLEVELFHFESTPLTSIESVQKVIDLAEKLTCFTINSKIKLHVVPFMKIHETILNTVKDSYIITIMRRMMMRLADRFCKSHDIVSISNGESLGQVASQTQTSMSVISEVTDMLIHRPLLSFDKNEIIKTAYKIDTFDISIRPFNDCCSIYVPKHPIIHPKLDECLFEESSFDYESLLNETLKGIYTIIIKNGERPNIVDLGLEFSEVKNKL